MFRLDCDLTVNGKPAKFSEYSKELYDKYFKTLQKKLDDIGEIVVEGIQSGIINRDYPGGELDVKRGGIPLYNTGQLYNSLTKIRINDSEVDVYINGDRSKIGMYQQQKGREFFGIYESTETQIENLLKNIVSDIT